ncbi:MAG TPA: crossover junction endodeoxyribonuclease RuvC [Candidatus Acidoferrum sp.]|nr:crossover junction endodeoxyribonuclease RuvC [Candidatus Acidoferrum sp.]
MTLILGIDPGSRKCGYGLVAAEGNNLQYVASGVIRVEMLPFAERLQAIFANLSDIIAEYHPHVAAMEEVFVGKSMASALKLGQARGAALVACTNQKLPVHEYAARKVKLALVGTGVADKAQMQHMITSLLKLSALPKEDAADALSVAVCHAHTQRTLIRLAGVRSGRRGRLLALPETTRK